MEDLIFVRCGHGCGTIYAQDGSLNKEVVVAGTTAGGGEGDYPAETYSTESGSWRESNQITFFGTDYVYGAASVPYGDSFFLAGGFDGHARPLDSFLLYVPGNDTWVEMPSRMRTPRGYPAVIPVKRSIFPSC